MPLTHALFWGITEFNAKSGPQVHSFGNGMLFGAILGYAQQYQARLALSWSIFESGGNRGKNDFSLFDGASRTPRPSAQHMSLFTHYMTGTTMAIETGNPHLLAFGSHLQQSSAVLIMNFERDSTTPYAITPQRAAGGDNKDKAQISFANATAKIAGSIRGMGTHVIIFEKGGVTRVTYSEEDFKAGRPPSSPMSVPASE